MSSDRRSKWLWRACSELGLCVEMHFRLSLPGDHELVSLARIADLGAPNGMLLFRSYEEVRGVAPHLLEFGYGFSVLDEPRQDEQFDLSSFQEMFRDWGWSGPLERKPRWI